MKQRHFILSAYIAAALAGAPGMSFAQSPASASNALAGISVSEAPRVTRAVINGDVTAISNTHLGMLGRAQASTPLAGSTGMNHLQLVLKPSAARQAAMEQLIANQHNPQSSRFQQWLTPGQFGEAFGVVDSDVAAVTAWLSSQGFTVNSVYPNKTQIDFSGTAAQVSEAFHTQEAIYTIQGAPHLANATDISIPSALQPVVAGVMGLTDLHATAFHKKSNVAQWDASKKSFFPVDKSTSAAGNPIGQAVTFAPGQRGLVPNDMTTMYGIKPLRASGITGKGITIAVVEDNDMVPGDWYNFVGVFDLGQYGGTFAQINPAPSSGANNCFDPNAVFGYSGDDGETLLDAEWATAIAPGANIVVASCSDFEPGFVSATSNFFGGVFIAASNLINGGARPDIISASYGYGEYFTDSASKTAIDLMWAQADAEGISVFVATGDSGSNPSFNGGLINGGQGNSAVDASSLATSPHVTGVGGTDLADVLDGTTSAYFAARPPSAVGGSALSYVPEIPWNNSCGNTVAAKAAGFSNGVAFCTYDLQWDLAGHYLTSEAGSGGPSSVDAKPAWQKQIHNAAQDQSRDLPDVSLFAGSYGGHTWVITCTSNYPCSPDFNSPVALSGGTSLATPMFAGIQALIDQGLAAHGLNVDQGNVAPTLYALAAKEYGNATGPVPASLGICNADNGTKGTGNCVFHNITRGSISSECYEDLGSFTTANCYFFDTISPWGAGSQLQVGLTSQNASPTTYTAGNAAYSAQPGWSFTSGLGSVNATNLLTAWRALVSVAAPSSVP
ncbi:protease pro-enzyme activation domain-containing protein [Rhodanobacter sp. MP7CTX1]|uniref:S53 family peptidase n=1 Tax=Rhodanobacter sp. MP7CTX1 TaxID=2723084 RepID=UPI001618F398|nr:protease pro-enzyme activation domain-containing protein [Rhodanobacter sp. MP7CTX1]MBB6188440.1 subtilase family serine protease [Rhodanobacter sp. MP7CTX1]